MKNYIIILVIIFVILFVVYMKRNKIVASVTPQLTKNFTLGELLVTSQPFPNIPDKQEIVNLTMLAVNVLQPIRDLLGKPVAINSAFRSEAVNKAVGGVDNSQHRLGFAADIHVPGMSILDAYKLIARSSIPYDQLIIEKNANGSEWIHVSYSPKSGRRQLLRATWNATTKKMDYTPMVV